MMPHLTSDDVLQIHAALIRDFGGAAGTRDPRLLDAAVNRPLSGYYDDAIQEASALWESLAQNHPFVDGNKRTGFACATRYLALNGLDLNEDAEFQAAKFILDLFHTGEFKFEKLDAWLRKRVIREPLT